MDLRIAELEQQLKDQEYAYLKEINSLYKKLEQMREGGSIKDTVSSIGSMWHSIEPKPCPNCESYRKKIA